MPDHLEQRHNTFGVFLAVPKDLQDIYGRKKLRQTLNTDSRSKAKLKAAPIIAKWKTEFAELRAARSGQDDIAAWIAEFRKAERIDGDEAGAPGSYTDTLHMVLSDYAEKIAKERGEAAAQKFVKAVDGRAVRLAPLVDPFLSSDGITPKTRDMKRSDLSLLLEKFETAEEVTRKTAADFIDQHLSPGRKPATVQRKVSSYLTFWQWMMDKGHIPEAVNPWSRQVGKFDKMDGARRPFTEAEGRIFLSAIADRFGRESDEHLIVQLQALTGMRAEEVASLRTKDVLIADGIAWLHPAAWRRGKTANARRKVPVAVPEIVADLERRKEAGEWLFPSLPVDRYGNRAQGKLQKTLASIRHTALPEDPSLVAQHSWRHRARTILEQAGIPHSTADFMVGHKRAGEGLGRYSRPSDAQLIEAARALYLPS